MDLRYVKFTNRADKTISDDGWTLSVKINALGGADKITGYGYIGISNTGTIYTAEGNDTIAGKSYYYGISNTGTIDTGKGNDTIIGTSRISVAISNDGTIYTGEGNDTITGKGGTTVDRLNAIYNAGTINTGKGDDKITGTGNAGYGILNVGTIDTGEGNDIVDALKGGFARGGKTYLGKGNDTLKGFGEGEFHGGSGKDKMLFGEGTFIITGSTIIQDGRTTDYGIVTMNVNQFEQIGGAKGGLFDFRDGTLTVNAAGVGTFA